MSIYSNKIRFQVSLQLIFLLGILITIIPIIMKRGFPVPEDTMSYESLPCLIAVKSFDFKVSLVASMSMSIHMLLDFCGQAILSREKLFSYRDSLSHLVLLICLLVPDMILLMYAIPQNNYILCIGIQYIRLISICNATLTYLCTFGGQHWKSSQTILGILTITIGSILKFYSFYEIGEGFITLETLSRISYGLSAIILAIPFLKWCRFLLRKVYNEDGNRMTTDEYSCIVYMVAATTIVASHWITSFIYWYTPWYNYDTRFFVWETMLFSFYYVVITVFQTQTAVREATLSKVSISTSISIS